MTWTYGKDLAGMAKILAHAAEHGADSIEAEYNPIFKDDCWSEHDAHTRYGNFTVGPGSACRYRIKRKPREFWINPKPTDALCHYWEKRPSSEFETIHVREVMDDE